jgi:methyl-accepting chemotaxis protein
VPGAFSSIVRITGRLRPQVARHNADILSEWHRVSRQGGAFGVKVARAAALSGARDGRSQRLSDAAFEHTVERSMSFRDYSLRKKLLFILVPMGLVYAMIVAYLFFTSSNSIIDRNAVAEQTRSGLVVQQMIDDFAAKALATAKIFAGHERIPAAYANPDEVAGSDFLAEGVRPIIERITRDRRIDSFKIHYHKPPARSFLRVWRDKRLDDLSGFRPTILEVYNTRAPVKAIEFGVGGFAVRGLAPIVFEGEYLGSVEFLYSIEEILDLLTVDQARSDMINIITADTARNALSEAQIEEFYGLQIDDFYLSAPDSDWADPEALLTPEVIEQMKTSDDLIIESYGDVFASFVPLFDVNETKIGYVLSLSNKSDVIASQRQGVLINVLIFAALLVALFAILIVIVGRLIIQPIERATRMAEEIARGNFDF